MKTPSLMKLKSNYLKCQDSCPVTILSMARMLAEVVMFRPNLLISAPRSPVALLKSHLARTLRAY